MIETAFIAFAVFAIVLFWFVPSRLAVAIVCFGGWLVLPVGNFPEGSVGAAFPYWITGAAIPSQMLLTKAWWPPLIAFGGAIAFDLKTVSHFRPNAIDAPIALWCVWPILQSLAVETPDPSPWASAAYLGACWGSPWVLGRIYFAGLEGHRLFLSSLLATLIVIVPIAIIEGVFGVSVYEWAFDVHPFKLDGQQRYIGFRPLGFFEHGNQYGIWAAAVALAGFECRALGAKNGYLAWLAVLPLLASQSVGAIMLFVACLVLRSLSGSYLRLILRLCLISAVMIGAVYFSRVVPVKTIAENTYVGRQLVTMFRSAGRESFTWRIARDQAALKVIERHPIIGTGRWDWWRENNERPWGLILLVAGQFGLVGLFLAFVPLLISIYRVPSAEENLDQLHRLSRGMSGIILIALGDALLNSFFLYPAILAAGAISVQGSVRDKHPMEARTVAARTQMTRST